MELFIVSLFPSLFLQPPFWFSNVHCAENITMPLSLLYFQTTLSLVCLKKRNSLPHCSATAHLVLSSDEQTKTFVSTYCLLCLHNVSYNVIPSIVKSRYTSTTALKVRSQSEVSFRMSVLRVSRLVSQLAILSTI